MVLNPTVLIDEFIESLNKAYNKKISKIDIVHEYLAAPHEKPKLPKGKCAVYVFSLPLNTKAPAGPNKILKVGMVGPNSKIRFKYQHYKAGSAKSTLPGAVQNKKILWDYIGINQEIVDYGKWVQKNTDRDNFYINADQKDIASLLEVYIRAKYGSVYEGSLKKDK